MSYLFSPGIISYIFSSSTDPVSDYCVIIRAPPIPSCPLFIISNAVLVVVDIAVHSIEVLILDVLQTALQNKSNDRYMVPAVVITITSGKIISLK